MAQIIHDAESLRPYVGCVLVPTMGALHEGHIQLIRKAAEAAGVGALRRTLVSVYVNPKQFNESSDFDSYPRSLGQDVVSAQRAGADAVFAPTDDVIYPLGEDEPDIVLPHVAQQPKLEDAFRPGHFEGVCRVVDRLFALTKPSAAVFGEKDWQQLKVVRAMAHVRHPRVEIIPCETVRESDGLAMSSRNQLLDARARASAGAIHQALKAAREEKDASAAEERMRHVLVDAGLEIEYACVRDARSLLPPDQAGFGQEGGRALIAARVQGVRLIDNIAWPAI